MLFRTIASLPLLALSLPALAAADLSTTLSAPAGVYVYDDGTVTVDVKNIGNKTAQNVSLVIDLPATHTSPSVYVMGDVGAMSSGCAASGTHINCNLGSIAKNVTKTVTVDIALPVSAASLDFSATASTTSAESTLSNNSDSDSASLLYYDIALAGPVDVLNSHCTGTGLTAWFECTLFPSAISDHETTLNADGSISFGPEGDGYTGAWSQPSDDALVFTYSYGSTVVASFEGYGADTGCFEGLTLFPGSSYVAPYEVCPQ